MRARPLTPPTAASPLRNWGWFANLYWLRLGPTAILLVQFEAVMVLLRTAGVGFPWGLSAVVASAVLIIITSAQLSITLSRWLASSRRRLLLMRREWEGRSIRTLRRAGARGNPLSPFDDDDFFRMNNDDKYSSGPGDDRWRHTEELGPPPSVRRRMARRMSIKTLSQGLWSIIHPYGMQLRSWLGRLDRAKADESPNYDAEFGAFGRVVRRFGMEPTWAFQLLVDGLHQRDAAKVTRESELVEARWAGQAAALCTFVVLLNLVALVWRGGGGGNDDAGSIALFAASYIGLILWGIALLRSGRAVAENAAQFYGQVETLLELHRFEIYRAVDLAPPDNSHEELAGVLLDWRSTETFVRYSDDDLHERETDARRTDEPDARSVEDVDRQIQFVREEVAGLTDFMRGPDVVAYQGYVSWQVRDSGVEIAFGSTPALRDGYARIEVEGTRTQTHAPFDISADSSQLALRQVRLRVDAPATGEIARTVVDFEPASLAIDEPNDIWLEISQRGRFIQLLKVTVHAQPQRLQP
jgi:hypothetical protein